MEHTLLDCPGASLNSEDDLLRKAGYYIQGFHRHARDAEASQIIKDFNAGVTINEERVVANNQTLFTNSSFKWESHASTYV